MRRAIALVFVRTVAQVRAARAQDAGPVTPEAKLEAKERAELGTRYFEAQEYAKAAEAYQAAYLLDPVPDLLYALGQAQRLGGDCEKALRSYQSFLRSEPPEDAAEKPPKNMQLCQDALDARAASQPASQPAPTPKERVIVKIVREEARPAPWTSDWLGHALVGAGIVVTTAGVLVWLSGEADVEALNHADTYGEFD